MSIEVEINNNTKRRHDQRDTLRGPYPGCCWLPRLPACLADKGSSAEDADDDDDEEMSRR